MPHILLLVFGFVFISLYGYFSKLSSLSLHYRARQFPSLRHGLVWKPSDLIEIDRTPFWDGMGFSIHYISLFWVILLDFCTKNDVKSKLNNKYEIYANKFAILKKPNILLRMLRFLWSLWNGRMEIVSKTSPMTE